jgi:hypothetical protein
LKEGNNGHGVPVAEIEVILQPSYYLACFHTRREPVPPRKSLVHRQSAKLVGRRPRFGLDILKIGLECHGYPFALAFQEWLQDFWQWLVG